MPIGNETTERTPKTHFAPAERASLKGLARGVELATRNPVIDGVLRSVGGVLAVLNRQRQILAVSRAFLDMLEVKDAGEILGFRPGEALRCVHAHDHEGGCGTGRFCSTCGAAIAVVASLDSREPEERDCILTTEKNGDHVDLYLRVRSCPIDMGGEPLLLLFIQDLTVERRRIELERVFFHDIGNILMSLQGASSLLAMRDLGKSAHLARQVSQSVDRLVREIAMQRRLVSGEIGSIRIKMENISIDKVFENLRSALAHHPAVAGRALSLPEVPSRMVLHTDPHVLLRILSNMTVNALEAAPEGGDVRVSADATRDGVEISVWNPGVMPEEIARRVFQRHFTTKSGVGRGLGTFAMRLLAEEWLGGRVSFTSTDEEGTVFRLWLPASDGRG